MGSKGPHNTKPFKVSLREGDYCYFDDPKFIRVNIHTGAIERMVHTGKNKGKYNPVALSASDKSGCLRFQVFKGSSASAARIILEALGVRPADSEHAIVCYRDNDRSNISPDNLYYGSLSESKGKAKGTWDPEWHKKLCELIPNPSDRTVKNPVYQKLYNQKKGKDGLTHVQRYYARLKAKMKSLRTSK